ncbi:MAG: hypothetical protein JNK29_17885 [Anaerolineales bacterium]|nr:hypothetical protein [Anaerolineales bacterium]
MPLESLSCPKCGAPLHLEAGQTLTVCLYCNSTVRVPAAGAAAPTAAVVERALPEADLEAVKKLLGTGRRAEALAAYRQMTGADAAETEAAVENLGRQLTAAVLYRQLLRPVGLVLFLAFTLLLAAVIGGWLAGWLNPWVALVVGALAAWQWVFFLGPLVRTVRYWRAPIAEAVTLKLAPIGVFKRSGEDIFAFRVWLEVRPAAGAPFRAEIQLPVRESNLARARAGAVLRVKSFPGDPASVLFHEKAEGS